MSSPAYAGGSGGYIKRCLFKNSARTPYERPRSAARCVRSTATVKGTDSRLLPTFMEPVSRYITRTACRLLSSVLPKRFSAQSGVEEKHFVKPDRPTVILVEQKLVDCGISDIEQFISQRWFTRAEAKHFMASINSRSYELLKSESKNNKQVKVLKRDISFLNDENVLLGPLCKIPKRSIIEEDKTVVNAPCTMAISGDQIMNTTIASHMAFPPQRKSYFHMSAPEDVDLDEDVVENVPCTIIASGGAIIANGMNETFTSTTSSMTIIRSSNTTISCHNTLPSQRKSFFHMSAPQDIDDSDEEYDVNEESDQSLFNLGTAMNDGPTEICGSNNTGDFTFPILIDLNNHFSPPSPTMGSPSHVKPPFRND